ncbi:MAG: hypothetical protein LBD40_00945 [Puniceicoccales bacterium]|jgi:hypothetical protein|nr:hypothetical protein [Puniceicoccales bacterium]
MQCKYWEEFWASGEDFFWTCRWKFVKIYRLCGKGKMQSGSFHFSYRGPRSGQEPEGLKGGAGAKLPLRTETVVSGDGLASQIPQQNQKHFENHYLKDSYRNRDLSETHRGQISMRSKMSRRP